MDASSLEFVQGLRNHNAVTEADLDVDGLTDSFFARLARLFNPAQH